MSYSSQFPSDYEVPAEIPAAFPEDVSWGNDMCPSFVKPIEGTKLSLKCWADHPDPEERETGPETKRFIVELDDEDGAFIKVLIETEDVEQAVLFSKVTAAEALSHVFEDLLRGELTSKQWEEMVRKNRMDPNPDRCASHNYLDANVTMSDAFALTFGRAFSCDGDNYGDTDTMNRAWVLFRTRTSG